MPEIITRPDTSWGLEQIRERFEIPLEVCPSEFDTEAQRLKKMQFVTMVGNTAAHKAIDTYTRLRHWKFRADLPVEIDESSLQFDPDDWNFSSPLSTEPNAVDSTHLAKSRATKAYVIKLWFETQKIQVPVVEYNLDDGESRRDGFVRQDELPAEALELMKEVADHGSNN